MPHVPQPPCRTSPEQATCTSPDRPAGHLYIFSCGSPPETPMAHGSETTAGSPPETDNSLRPAKPGQTAATTGQTGLTRPGRPSIHLEPARRQRPGASTDSRPRVRPRPTPGAGDGRRPTEQPRPSSVTRIDPRCIPGAPRLRPSGRACRYIKGRSAMRRLVDPSRPRPRAGLRAAACNCRRGRLRGPPRRKKPDLTSARQPSARVPGA